MYIQNKDKEGLRLDNCYRVELNSCGIQSGALDSEIILNLEISDLSFQSNYKALETTAFKKRNSTCQ